MARISQIKKDDIGNGPGICTSVFMQGCHFHCKGCFNESTWDFDKGEPATDETIDYIISTLNEDNVCRNLSILGGEPLAEENRDFVLKLIKETHSKSPTSKIWLWSGYEFEELEQIDEIKNGILKEIDAIIVGRFDINKRDLSLRYMGSSNQRLLLKGKDF